MLVSFSNFILISWRLTEEQGGRIMLSWADSVWKNIETVCAFLLSERLHGLLRLKNSYHWLVRNFVTNVTGNQRLVTAYPNRGNWWPFVSWMVSLTSALTLLWEEKRVWLKGWRLCWPCCQFAHDLCCPFMAWCEGVRPDISWSPFWPYFLWYSLLVLANLWRKWISKKCHQSKPY